MQLEEKARLKLKLRISTSRNSPAKTSPATLISNRSASAARKNLSSYLPTPLDAESFRWLGTTVRYGCMPHEPHYIDSLGRGLERRLSICWWRSSGSFQTGGWTSFWPSKRRARRGEVSDGWSMTETEGDTLSQDKAAPFIVNFKMVDTNSDGKITEDEFKEGCKKGLVQKQANKPGETGGGQTPEQPEKAKP